MKCKQKSCKRNQNLNITSGFCNVCHDVYLDATDNVQKKAESNKQVLKKVELDHKEMIKLHEKLSRGEVVDPASTNNLILAGIINILIHQSALEELEVKVETFEQENVSNKARIESLESWNSKQANEIKKLRNDLEVLDKNDDIVKETPIGVVGTNMEISNLNLTAVGGR